MLTILIAKMTQKHRVEIQENKHFTYNLEQNPITNEYFK